MFAVPLDPLSPLAPPPAAEPGRAGLRPLLDACGLGWFCLRAAGRREHLAALNLTHRNAIEAFAPRIRVRREVRTGGVRTVTEALFPGYLFARFRYPEQARHVVSTTDVLGLVAFGGPPPRLADGTIAHLRQHASPAAVAPLCFRRRRDNRQRARQRQRHGYEPCPEGVFHVGWNRKSAISG